VAFLSLHSCVLELETGMLAILPMPDCPIERDWHVMHLAGRPVPAAAAAFEQFLRVHGQAWIHWRLEHMRRKTAAAATPAVTAVAEPAVPVRKKAVRSAA
jgi:hypothetical protein